jgi:hypothetical protein
VDRVARKSAHKPERSLEVEFTIHEREVIHLQPIFRQHNVRSLEVHAPHKVLLELLPHISSTLSLFNVAPMKLLGIFQSRSTSPNASAV